MISKYILFLILGIDALILFFQTSQVSISYSEAQLLYGDFSFLQLLIKSSISVFGQNDFGLHFVMIIFHLLSALLIYEISKRYITKDRNRIWLVLVFILLPGVISAAIVVNAAGMVIFGLLLFTYLFPKLPLPFLNTLLIAYTFIDHGFAYLFLSLSLYYYVEKNYKQVTFLIILYLLNSFLFGFYIDGLPRGHFLDAIGVYSAIFTPIIFIYLFYNLYRRYLTGEIDFIWYIAAVPLLLSLVLSFRQRVEIEYFAPYLIIALPLAAQSFISSYRVRLKEHRTRYRLIFIFSFSFLTSNALLVNFNKNLYAVLDDPRKHFAYKMHIAKELSSILKEKGIECVQTNDRMQLKLHFYKIEKCERYKLYEQPLNIKIPKSVTVSYKNKVVYRATVTIINNI
jgi:hypothetical protein